MATVLYEVASTAIRLTYEFFSFANQHPIDAMTCVYVTEFRNSEAVMIEIRR